MDDVVLRVKDLSKEFRGKRAVDGLTLQVRRGEIYGFLGPNGAGKSTTIRMIVGLVRPTGGFAELTGFDVRSHRPEALRDVGALVEAPAFYRYLSARENLRILGRMSGGCSEDRIREVLDIVGLSKDADRRLGTFSQGMRQRLGIGQAILSSPRLLILDEPTNGLDPQGVKDVRDLIRRLAGEGVTIFLSSHMLYEVEQVCTRVGIVNKGKLLAEENVSELLAKGSGETELHVGNLESALRTLARMGLKPSAEPEKAEHGWKVVLRGAGTDLSSLNRELVAADVPVFAIFPDSRTLESLFLDLVREDSDVL